MSQPLAEVTALAVRSQPSDVTPPVCCQVGHLINDAASLQLEDIEEPEAGHTLPDIVQAYLNQSLTK